MNDFTVELYKIVDGGFGLELAPETPVHNGIVFRNPNIFVFHKLGYWKKMIQPIVEAEEGYHILDKGYVIGGDGEDRFIYRDIKKLLIVDNKPTIGDNQIIENDRWEEQGDKWVHVYPVWTVVDKGEPEVDEDHHLAGSSWEYDEEIMVKRRVYHVLTKVDNPPILEEGQQIFEDHWEIVGDEYVHMYEVRVVVDNPPELEEGQQVLESHWEDDGYTATKVYDRVRFVVDNKPVLEEGQKIVDQWEEDDGTTVTHHYKVRFVVDNPPELEENQEIYEEHWDDDGVTLTHVYVVLTVIEPEPPAIEENQELEDLGWEMDYEAKTRTHKYKVWTVVDEGPKPTSGYLYEGGEPTRVKDEESGTITVEYPYVTYPCLRVSKFELEVALGKLGKLTAFQNFLASLPDIDFGNGETRSVQHFYNTANDLKTDNQLCVPYIEAGAKAIGMSVNDVFALLKRCEVKIG